MHFKMSPANLLHTIHGS